MHAVNDTYTPIRFKKIHIETGIWKSEISNWWKYLISQYVRSWPDGMGEDKRKHLHDQPSAPEAAMINHILFFTSPTVWKRAATISMTNWISTAACMNTIHPKIERVKCTTFKYWQMSVYLFLLRKLLLPHTIRPANVLVYPWQGNGENAIARWCNAIARW